MAAFAGARGGAGDAESVTNGSFSHEGAEEESVATLVGANGLARHACKHIECASRVAVMDRYLIYISESTRA